VLPPLCPLAATSYDFSRSRDLIHRAEAASRLWLQKNGLHSRGVPMELGPHHHGE
jgi:NTE family protein